MNKNILVSLISKETIPNVQLINEFKKDIDIYLFICTEEMVNQRDWIVSATGIRNPDTIFVDPYDIEDIERKLNTHKFDDDNFFVNITGGTKLMSIAVDEYFRKLGAKIYYLTGRDKTLLKIFPAVGTRNFKLQSKISLEEYLTAYGFEIKKSTPIKDFEMSRIFFKAFLDNEKNEDFVSAIDMLRKERNTKNLQINKYNHISKLIQTSSFKPEKEGVINKYEIRYLTGEWLEEYIYFKIKNELNLNDSEIGIGFNIRKNDTPNEIDVLFVYKDQLYVIECKTSFYDVKTVVTEKRGEKIEKEEKRNLFTEIIYKSDALRSKFGLFAQTILITTGQIFDSNGEIINEMKSHIKRAEENKIKIISRKDLLQESNFKKLLNIY